MDAMTIRAIVVTRRASSGNPAAESRLSRLTGDRGPFLTALAVSLGVLATSLGNTLGRTGTRGAAALWWLGISIIAGSCAFSLLRRDTSRDERLASCVLLYLGLYLVKVVYSPTTLRFHDELGQLRSVQDSLLDGRLFHENPLVANYASFPGLHALTVAVSQTTGLSAVVAALILMGAVRLVLSVALFLTLEKVLGDSWSAGVATFVYAANPSFLYFDAQFGYESLALPLAVAVLALVLLRRREARARRWWRYLQMSVVTAVILVLALVASHHIVSWFLIVVLGVGLLVGGVTPLRRRSAALVPPVAVLGVLGVAAGCWYFLVARRTSAEELGPVVTGAAQSVLDLVLGRSHAKKVFGSQAGYVDPVALRLVGLASVALVLLLLIVVAIQLLRKRAVLDVPITIALGLAVLYPLALLFRLTPQGSETAQRTSEFVYLGVGVAAAMTLRRQAPTASAPQSPAWLAPIGCFTGVLLLAGGVVVGTSPFARVAAPYAVEGDPRSADGYGIAAANWAGQHLPPGTRFFATRSLGQLLVSRTRLELAHGQAAGYSVDVVISSSDRALALTVAHAARIDFVAVDDRLAERPPLAGRYFEGGGEAGGRVVPLTEGALHKFDKGGGVVRIYDNGYVRIYDLRQLLRARS